MGARRLSPLLLLSVLAILIAIPVHLALGVESVPANDGTRASRMVWPEGVDLLAAVELNLPGGGYDWQITVLTLDETDTAFNARNGILVTASGTALVQVNGRETLRVERNDALAMFEGDRWQLRSADGERATVLVAELLPEWAPRTDDDASIIGRLDVPAGDATMILVNLDKDRAVDTAQEEVMQDALRPGVSIRHDEAGIPDAPDPSTSYDRWVIALFAYGGGQPAPVPTQPPTTPQPIASPTNPATPTVTGTPTTAGTPTNTPTATDTPTPTNTPMETYTPTPSPTSTDTPTPTPSPTPTDTPTPTPSPTPTNTPTPTPSPTPTDTPTPTPTNAPLVFSPRFMSPAGPLSGAIEPIFGG